MVVGWIYRMYLLNFERNGYGNRAAGVPLNAILYIIVTPELTRSPLKTLHSPTYQTSQPKKSKFLVGSNERESGVCNMWLGLDGTQKSPCKNKKGILSQGHGDEIDICQPMPCSCDGNTCTSTTPTGHNFCFRTIE